MFMKIARAGYMLFVQNLGGVKMSNFSGENSHIIMPK
jgi:hypothetical protein